MTSTPISVSPLRNTPTITAPISVPMMLPRPPKRLVPPMTTAVMLSRFSVVWPAFGSPSSVRATRSSAAMPGRQPGERVDAEQDAVRVDAGQPRRLGVVADGVDVSAPGGLREREPGDRVQHEHEDDAVGEVRAPDRERPPEEEQLAREPRERQVVRDDVRQRERDVERAERDDERRQPRRASRGRRSAPRRRRRSGSRARSRGAATCRCRSRASS